MFNKLELRDIDKVKSFLMSEELLQLERVCKAFRFAVTRGRIDDEYDDLDDEWDEDEWS